MRKLLILALLCIQSLGAQLPAPVPFAGWSAAGAPDGTPAVRTPISAWSFATAADGTIVYLEDGRIRRIDNAGKVQTLVTDPAIATGAIAVDPSGNLYYSTPQRAAIWLWKGGLPVRIAGGGAISPADGVLATDAKVFPRWIAVHPDGTLYFTDLSARVFKIDAAGILRLVAGTGTLGTSGEGGPAISAQLSNPQRLGFDAAGTLYLDDNTLTGARILKIDASGTLSRVAGPQQYAGGFSVGPDGSIYYSTLIPPSFWKQPPNGAPAPVMVSGGVGFAGCGPGPFPPRPLGIIASQASADSRGLLLLTPSLGQRQRLLRVDASGTVSTVAGGPDAFSGDGGPATEATLSNPEAIATDASGNLFIADTGNHRVRMVSADGTIRTVAGTGPVADTLYCSAPSTGYLDWISGIAVGRDGTLFISDLDANRVWKVDPGASIVPFAGNGQATAHAAQPGSQATGGRAGFSGCDCTRRRWQRVGGQRRQRCSEDLTGRNHCERTAVGAAGAGNCRPERYRVSRDRGSRLPRVSRR